MCLRSRSGWVWRAGLSPCPPALFNSVVVYTLMHNLNYKLPQDSATLENRSILVIEDDPDIAELIRMHLSDIYETVCVARDGIDGKRLANSEHWDLIVLDLRLPGKNGLDLCRELRADEDYVPILMLTSRSSELDRVHGLELGADDYMTKPFSVMELAARIKAIFRRISAAGAKTDSNNEAVLVSEEHQISLDTRVHRVQKDGKDIELTAKEFDLLCYFLQSPGTVFSRAHLLNKIWGLGHEGYEHTVNSHINRLRGKIEDDPNKPEIITTVWGVGYKLTEPA